MNIRPLARTWAVMMTVVGLMAGIVGGGATIAAAQGGEFLPDGTTVEWDAPWQLGTTNLDGSAPSDNRLNLWTENAYFVLELFDDETEMSDATDAVLTEFAVDPANGLEVAGGSSRSVGPGGTVTSQSEHRVYLINRGGEDIGVYVQLDDLTKLMVLIARADGFAAEMASAQDGIQVDDAGVFNTADGESAERSLVGRAGEAPEIASESTVSEDGAGGEYTDESGNVQVTWPDGWTIFSSNEGGIILINEDETMQVYVQGVLFDGRTWEQAAADTQAWLFDDQGEDASVSGPTVTDDGFMFITDGAYGPRMVQAIPSADPELFVLIFAANIEPGADLAALAEEAQTIMVNDAPALQGIDDLIEPAA